MELATTRLADLQKGDVLLAVNGVKRRQSLTVRFPLGPITLGSPVQGVTFEDPYPGSIEYVFYPSQMDGQVMTIDRPN